VTSPCRLIPVKEASAMPVFRMLSMMLGWRSSPKLITRNFTSRLYLIHSDGAHEPIEFGAFGPSSTDALAVLKEWTFRNKT
jgi:hypothetical protein